MKTILFNILPDYDNSFITSSAAYNFFVTHITNYLQAQGPSCTVRIDMGNYTFEDINSNNSFYIQANKSDSEPYIHIAISGEAISEVDDKIKFYISKSEVSSYKKVTVFEKDVLSPQTHDYLTPLTSAYTLLTVKDCPNERILYAKKSDIFVKSPQSNYNSQDDDNRT